MNFPEQLKFFQERIEKHLKSDLPDSSQRPARLRSHELQFAGWW